MGVGLHSRQKVSRELPMTPNQEIKKEDTAGEGGPVDELDKWWEAGDVTRTDALWMGKWGGCILPSGRHFAY